ncbi:MAG TPA: NADP-dependent oxidoreductase, partial [Bacillales bacterium]|nr:NADP-dependent oxidoreductase [Bacillales bacterium]
HGEASAKLAKWIADGKIKYRETVVEGFENTPKAFLGLFHGENIGKQLVKV